MKNNLSGTHRFLRTHYLFWAAFLLMLMFLPGRSVRVLADDEIEEHFNLPFSNEWTSGETTSNKNVHLYKITTSRPGYVTVDIQNMKSGQIFFFLDENRGNLGQITSGSSGGIWGGSETSPYNGSRSFYLEAGTYYVNVHPWDYGPYFGKYKLKASFFDAGNQETEPNQDSNQAMPIVFNKEYKGLISVQDTTDWYRFTVEGTDPITLMFRVYCSGIDWQIHRSDLVGITGGTEYGGSLTAPKTRYFTRTLAPGSYYLRVAKNSAYGYYDFLFFHHVSHITLSAPTEMYVGEPQTVQATITPSNASFPKLTWTSSNPAVATVSDQGVVTPKAAGTVTITAAANDGVNQSASVKINVVVPALEIEQNKFTLMVGETAQIKITKLVPEGNVGYASSLLKVATVDDTGKITAVGAGKCQIKVWKGKVSKTVNVTVKRYSQKITGPKSSYVLTLGDDPFRLNAKTSGDGRLTYASSNYNVAKVSSAGRVSVTGIGTAKITIIASETSKYAKKTKSINIKVNPKKVTLKSVVNVKGKKVKVTWKRGAGIDGYEIEYSTKSNFKSGKKSIDVGSAKTTTRTLTGLKKGKTYYIRIRAYKDADDGNTYTSAWTKKSVEITQ